MSTAKKTIAVLGASGLQGGSVVTHLLAQPALAIHFDIRALSRNPDALSNKPWSNSVPDRRHADVDDLASLQKAFDGVHTVFAMTNYWEHQSLERDIQQGRNIADAALAAGVTHLIWSAQYSASQIENDPNKTTQLGALDPKAGTLDGKAAVMDYIETVKSSRDPPLYGTYPIAGFYMQNLPRFMVKIERSSEGDTELYVWHHPWDYELTQAPLLDAADLGLFVAGIVLRELEAPGSTDGRRLHCVSEWATPKAMIEGFNRVMNSEGISKGTTDSIKTKKELRFVDVKTEEGYKAFLPDFFSALPPYMVRYRTYPLFGQAGPSLQPQHNSILTGLEGRLTNWEEYVRKYWENDWHG